MSAASHVLWIGAPRSRRQRVLEREFQDAQPPDLRTEPPELPEQRIARWAAVLLPILTTLGGLAGLFYELVQHFSDVSLTGAFLVLALGGRLADAVQNYLKP